MHESDPTIYIVGGLPRTGKSTVADRLSHDLRIGSMETDHIRMLFNASPTSKIRVNSGHDIDIVTQKIRPRLESLVGSLFEEKSSLILNGECIDPHMITDSKYHSRIISCFMGLDDPEKAYARIREIAKPNDWTLRMPDDALKILLEKYSVRSRVLGQTCLELGLPYIDASDDFVAAHDQAYAVLNPQNIIVTDFMKPSPQPLANDRLTVL